MSVCGQFFSNGMLDNARTSHCKNTRNGPRSLHSLRIVSRTFLRCSFARIIAFQDEKTQCSFRLQGMLDDAWTSHSKNTRNGPRSFHSLRIVSRTFLRCSFARIIAFQDEKTWCCFRLQGMLDDAWTSHSKNTRNGPRSLHSLRNVSRTFLQCVFTRIIAFQDEKTWCSFRLQGMYDDVRTSHSKNTRNGPRSL